MVHSHLQFIRRELLHKLFSPCNRKKWVHNPLLNFSFNAIVDEISGVNAPIYYSVTHYSTISSGSRNSWENRRCEWTIISAEGCTMYKSVSQCYMIITFTVEKVDFHATGKSIYLTCCRSLDVVPVSYFIRHINDSRLQKAHHGIGVLGAKAMAIPLVVSTRTTG